MKNNRPISVAVLIPLITIILAGSFIYISNGEQSNSTDDSTLPIERYIESPKSFSGNEYSLAAYVDSQLSYAEGKGRIILLKTFSNKSIPIFVTPSVKGFNPNVGQRYDFETLIDGEGKLVMASFRKL